MSSSDLLFKTDCRHFRPDRPCLPHKERGAVCAVCTEHDPVNFRLLVLKVGALGDVLRTTALLPALREKRPQAHVTWVADRAALPLFENHAAADRVLPYAWDTLVLLRRELFDEVWSLDVDPAVAAWVPDLRAGAVRGFVYADGKLAATGAEARGWLEMSLNDELKRANRRTYQDWMFSVCGLSSPEKHAPLWTVSPAEAEWAAGRRAAWKLPAGTRLLGINTGAGGRWNQKKWTEPGLAALLRLLKKEKKVRVLLLGGPEERERNRRLKKSFPAALDAGCDNDLRRFAALLDLCDAVVTGDTLAMHVAVALKKRTVALFGPTSAAEIELYGRGEKVMKDWDCLPCYRAECRRAPNCMEALAPDEVLAAVRRQLRG